MKHMQARIMIAAFLAFAAGTAAADDKPKLYTPSEPTTCFRLVGLIDESITVGLAVELCGGTTDAKATLACFDEAFGAPHEGGLGLTRGQATWLCRTAGASTRQ
jgi:hypothetical protein